MKFDIFEMFEMFETREESNNQGSFPPTNWISPPLPLECSPQKLYPHSVRGLEYSGARAKAAKALVFWFSENDQKAKQWVANSLENPRLEQIPLLVGFVCTVYPRMYIFVCKYIASQLPLYFYLWNVNPFFTGLYLGCTPFLVGWCWLTPDL